MCRSRTPSLTSTRRTPSPERELLVWLVLDPSDRPPSLSSVTMAQCTRSFVKGVNYGFTVASRSTAPKAQTQAL